LTGKEISQHKGIARKFWAIPLSNKVVQQCFIITTLLNFFNHSYIIRLIPLTEGFYLHPALQPGLQEKPNCDGLPGSFLKIVNCIRRHK